jgi:aminoglycoside phosphotransferase (APT) family kinase protein
MAVRLPRTHRAVAQVENEHRVAAETCPHLRLAIPLTLAKGTPRRATPWYWSVYRWLQGEKATIDRSADLRLAATELT